jgi:hypothetical protein
MNGATRLGAPMYGLRERVLRARVVDVALGGLAARLATGPVTSLQVFGSRDRSVRKHRAVPPFVVEGTPGWAALSVTRWK